MFSARRARLRKWLAKLRVALRTPVFDDEKVLAKFDADSKEGRRFRLDLLEGYIGYSTDSIKNSYLKAQIGTGIDVGTIVLFVGVLRPIKGVILPLLVVGVMMNAASVVLLRFVTGHRAYIWTEAPTDFGAVVYNHENPLAKTLFREKRKRANYNRRVLLRNRRFSFMATWFLAVPGFVIGMMAFSWVGVLVTISVGLVLWLLLQRWLRLELIEHPDPGAKIEEELSQ